MEKWERLNEIFKQNNFEIIPSFEDININYGNDATFDCFEYDENNDALTIYNYDGKEVEFLYLNGLNKKTLQKAIDISFSGFDNLIKRVEEIEKLEDNWDNYGGFSPGSNIVYKTFMFLQNLPWKFKELLNEDNIFPNPNGTITIEWRNEDQVISIEIGNPRSNYYHNNIDFEIKFFRELIKYIKDFVR
jgi:hypothetical protein